MRRERSDSITAQVKAAQDATVDPIEPPSHVALRDGDRPFWESIVSARARETWGDADLEMAGNLARCKADVERLQKEINTEGDVLTNERGTQIMNPKHTLLETLSRRAVALSRMLHVHAEATLGKSEDAAKTLAGKRVAKRAAQSTDDLIPRIHAVR